MKTKLKQTKGITLIALIITIIILLILAMVTIRILMNQGIIKHAENATAAYNEAQNNETEYLTYAEGEMDKYAGTSRDGKGDDADTTAPEDLQKYLLSPSLTGRGIFDILDSSTFAFKDKDGEGSIESASTKVKFLNLYSYTTVKEESVNAFYIKYNNIEYKVMTKGQTFTTDPTAGVTKVYEPKSGTKEGTIVKYSADGSATKTDWLVLYDNGNTLDIMSVNTMGSLTLGSKDEKATNDTNNTDEGLGKAINSYNNMYSRVNNYCKSLITNTTAQKVRSVGSKPDFSATDTTATYSSEQLSTLIEGYYNNVGKVGDTNAESDVIRMSFYDQTGSTFGYAKSDAEYWLASRNVYEGFSNASFNAMSVGNAGNTYSSNILWSMDIGLAYSSSPSHAVRPVVRVAVSDVS